MKQLKKLIFIPILVLVLLASSCSGGSTKPSQTLADEILQSVEFEAPLTQMESGDAQSLYGFDEGEAQVLAYVSSGAFTDELAIITPISITPAAAKENILSRQKVLISDYSSYRPQEVSKLENMVLLKDADRLILCFSNDVNAAGKIKDLLK